MNSCTRTVTRGTWSVVSDNTYCGWCMQNGCVDTNEIITTYGEFKCECVNDHSRMNICACPDHSKMTIFSLFRGRCSICKLSTSHEKLTVCDECSSIHKVCRVCGSNNAKPYRFYK